MLMLNSFISRAQCKLEINDFFKLMTVNISDFETILIQKGFNYNAKGKVFYCDNNEYYAITNRDLFFDRFGFVYQTTEKENYLSLKKQLNEKGFNFEKDYTKDTLNYYSDNWRFILSMDTIEKKTIFNIFITYSLSD